MNSKRPNRNKEAKAPSASSSSTAVSQLTSTEHDLVIMRIINAPRERVFKAWTDPSYMTQWWGPHGYTTPLCEMDVRPGGTFRMHMRAPDGTIYPIKGFYREVVEPERLVYSDDWDEGFMPSSVSNVTVTFTEQEGNTLLTIRPFFGSVEERDAMQQKGLIEGWAEGLERLELHLSIE
ncbi:MAG: SRPBCC domain-containing protein [Pseudomonas sp.]